MSAFIILFKCLSSHFSLLASIALWNIVLGLFEKGPEEETGMILGSYYNSANTI